MQVSTEHGIICDCGKTFEDLDGLDQHLTVKQVLEEVKRIGGEKFRKVCESWENDGHSGGFSEFCESHGIELTPENATRVAKEAIKAVVERHDEYGLDHDKG